MSSDRDRVSASRARRLPEETPGPSAHLGMSARTQCAFEKVRAFLAD